MSSTICPHLRAVVEELERRGVRQLSTWVQHRNDELYAVYLAPRVSADEVVQAVAPDVLRTLGRTGCYRGPATAIQCTCPDGAWQTLVLAKQQV